MKTIGAREEKLIKRYMELRGTDDPQYKLVELKDFEQAYLGGAPKERQQFLDEMKRYIKAVDSGKIKAGEHIRQTTFAN